jgi:hypothetical protein
MGLTGVSSDSYWRDILSGISAPDTQVQRDNMNAWYECEGGTATYNPFNTTEPWPGATNYNSVGVKNYPSYQAGVSATIATLENGYYPGILAALRNGYNRASFAAAVGGSPWGTSGACIATAPGNPVGGTPGPTGPIKGGTIPNPPVEHARDDWSSHIKRSAHQFMNQGNALDRYARAIRALRLHGR